MEERGPTGTRCTHRGLFFVWAIYEDYVLLGCPECTQEFGVPVGSDHD